MKSVNTAMAVLAAVLVSVTLNAMGMHNLLGHFLIGFGIGLIFNSLPEIKL